MFKTALTAAAFTLIAGFGHAAEPALDLPIEFTASAPTAPAIQDALQFDQVSNYCEWVTIYDAWGNWLTVWQCY